MAGRRKYNCIYVLFGPNKSAYVGQTTDPINRKSRYKTMTCKNQRLVFESLSLYGWPSHQFKVVIELPVGSTREAMDFYETFYYSLYAELGYKMLNLKSTGWNGKPCAESLKRQSESHKGRTPWNKGRKGVQEAWNKGLTKTDYANR